MWLGPLHTRPTPGTAFITTSAGSRTTPAASSAIGAPTSSIRRNGPTTPSTAAPWRSRAPAPIGAAASINTVKDYDVTFRYENGVVMTCKPGNPSIKFIGSDGWVGNTGWRGPLEASSKEILNSVIGPEEIHLYTNPAGEHDDFLKCVRSRKDPYFPVDIGHRVSTRLPHGQHRHQARTQTQVGSRGRTIHGRCRGARDDGPPAPRSLAACRKFPESSRFKPNKTTAMFPKLRRRFAHLARAFIAIGLLTSVHRHGKSVLRVRQRRRREARLAALETGGCAETTRLRRHRLHGNGEFRRTAEGIRGAGPQDLQSLCSLFRGPTGAL